MWGIKEKKKARVKKIPKEIPKETPKETPSEKVSNLPLGTGTLNQAAEAIKKRKKKQADMMKELDK